MFRAIVTLLMLEIGLLSSCLADQSPPSAGTQSATSCANPALPAQILDGPPARTGATTLSLFGVQAPKARLRLAVAGDALTREFGLMCVTRLRPNAGMIFVFDAAQTWAFWMKNTLIPLDMIWLEQDGTVSSIAENVPASTLATPDDAIARRSGHGVYVIELSAGEAERDGIVTGTKLTICERGVLRAHASGLLDCFERTETTGS
jgi:uncharacterized membrane protein (UPF0127 family)